MHIDDRRGSEKPTNPVKITLVTFDFGGKYSIVPSPLYNVVKKRSLGKLRFSSFWRGRRGKSSKCLNYNLLSRVVGQCFFKILQCPGTESNCCLFLYSSGENTLRVAIFDDLSSTE